MISSVVAFFILEISGYEVRELLYTHEIRVHPFSGISGNTESIPLKMLLTVESGAPGMNREVV
jgi:hypothetical protein